MHRRYTVSDVAAAISDTDEADDSEAEGMVLVQNEEEEKSEIEEEMSDIEEEVSAVDFVGETREPEQTENDFNKNSEDFAISFVSSSGKR